MNEKHTSVDDITVRRMDVALIAYHRAQKERTEKS